MLKVRAQKVTIETPREGAEPWIRVIVQRVEKTGDIVNTVDRWDSFNKRLSDVAAQAFPIPGSFRTHDETFITVYDVATSISTVVIGWLLERYGGSVDAEGNVILEE